MKKISVLAILTALFALCSAAFAGEKQTFPITIYESARIGAVAIPAGDYRMSVDREGDKVKFTLLRGKTALVECDAHFSDMQSFSAPVAVVKKDAQVTQIQVAKLKGAVVFD